MIGYNINMQLCACRGRAWEWGFMFCWRCILRILHIIRVHTVFYCFDMKLLSGIHFEKDKGQHILKNPLVINSMIEKVL